MLYALLVLKAGLPEANQLDRLAALVITASIVAHSSTDVLIARWLRPAAEARKRSDDPIHGADQAGPEPIK